MKKIPLILVCFSIFLSINVLTVGAQNLQSWSESNSFYEAFNEECCLEPGPSLDLIISKVTNNVLGFLGLATVVIILIGSYKKMTAKGNKEILKEAKALMIRGVITLIIIACAWIIVQLILWIIK